MSARKVLTKSTKSLALGIVAFLLLLTVPSSSFGQRSSLPQQNYYQNFFQYYSADYSRAERQFSQNARSAFKFGDTRFLDSVCYWVMIGECHYHMGNYDQAMQLYDTALGLYLTYNNQNWQGRVKLPPTVQVSTTLPQQAQVNWFNSKRAAKFSNLPNTFQVLFGDLEPGRALVEGGVVDPAKFRQVDVQEIMRCVALALYRRNIILGPTAQHNALTQQLSASLRGNGARGSILGAWNGVILGLAKSANDDRRAATQLLARSLQLTGNIDHWLTPIALLELSRLAHKSNETAIAQEFAMEAAYCAAVFNQFDLAEEALGFATTLHLTTNQTPFAPLEPAIAWAARNRAKLMQASLTVKLAECFGEAGDAVSASRVLAQVRRATNRSSLPASVVGSRVKYVAALIQFLEGNGNAGRESLAEALKQFQTGSLWLYRLAVADQLTIEGSITPRQADALYSLLLHDPTADDWKMDPMEALSFLSSPHVGAMERWFEIKVAQRNAEQALTVSELVKRHRFFSSLPMGGRLLAFRWVMEAPIEAISDASRKQRMDFLSRNPAYKTLGDRAIEIRNELLRLPLKPDPESDEYREQIRLYVELKKIADSQETMLASFALRREPSELAFPPECDLSNFRDRIGEHQIALVCVATEVGYHMFFVGREGERYLGMGRGNKVRGAIAQLFKKLGIKDHSGQLSEEQLRDETWKEASFELAKQLFGEASIDDWKDYKEVVVVPDGALWYLPFEVLQIGPDLENSKPLNELVVTRYSPTLGLAFGKQRPERQIQRSIVVAGRLHPKMDKSQTMDGYNEILNDFPKAVYYDSRIKVPMNLMGTITDQLIVLTDMKIPRSGAYGMSPAQADEGEGSSLGGWLSLPWQGPEHIILPGFTSAGASGMKSRANGEELFLTSCALMASGVRSILITRWRVGGDNGIDLVREYAKRLKTLPAGDALSESVKLTSEMELEPEREPRVKTKTLDDPLKATHPLFWAGHLAMEIPNKGTADLAKTDNKDDADKKADPDPNAKPDPDAPAGPDDKKGADDKSMKDLAGDVLKPAEDKKSADDNTKDKNKKDDQANEATKKDETKKDGTRNEKKENDNKGDAYQKGGKPTETKGG